MCILSSRLKSGPCMVAAIPTRKLYIISVSIYAWPKSLLELNFYQQIIIFQSASTIMTWQSNAQGKRTNLNELIPPKWRIPTSDIPSVTRLRDFGEYTCRFLDRQELEITNAPSARILANIRSGEWTSVDVTRAFCHRASVAHQLVSGRLSTHIYTLSQVPLTALLDQLLIGNLLCGRRATSKSAG